MSEVAKQDVEVMKQDAMQVIKGNLRLLDFEEITGLTSLQQVTKYVGNMNLKINVLGLAGIGVLIIGLMMLISPRSRQQKRRKKFEMDYLTVPMALLPEDC